MSANNEMGRFYSAEEVREFYPEIVPVYQRAYAGEPWFEVSACADSQRPQRCVASLSAVAIGETCQVCGNTPTKPAYDPGELTARLDKLSTDKSSVWYLEREADELVLAALLWNGDAKYIAEAKYADVPEMANWMPKVIGTNEVVWLDEIFADRTRRPNGNLRNFSEICRQSRLRLGPSTMAFRTINEKLVAATERDFDGLATVFNRQSIFGPGPNVPDRRDFVTVEFR
ncbi:MAG TPA: hypothetical protein VFB03_01550 [Candidatus Saccharimonadales bacterium]|nr:hypothetical protein [Candidatus Saccharimonadales bacterium]